MKIDLGFASESEKIVNDALADTLKTVTDMADALTLPKTVKIISTKPKTFFTHSYPKYSGILSYSDDLEYFRNHYTKLVAKPSEKPKVVPVKATCEIIEHDLIS